VIQIVTSGAIMFGIAWNQVRNEEIETRQLTQDLGAPIPPVGIEDAPIDFVVPKPPGTIVLDLRHSGFEIEPAPPGQPLSVEAKFDAEHYGLTHSFDEEVEGGSWSYELSFRRTSRSSMITALKELLGGARPRVKIFLPSDVPFDLDLGVSQGGAELELGGLWMRNADIRFLQGGGALEISEPLQEPADSLSIRFGQGGGSVSGQLGGSGLRGRLHQRCPARRLCRQL